ncbi:MAG: restriction endonuclease subunit S [Spirochaetales bacterium]|nr:restriction endonuclease subunit S [Spirochaetales bacterium]
MNIFQINRSDIEDRFDPPYYKDKPDFSKFIKLSKIAVVKGGKRIPLGMSYTTEQTNYLYLRVADMLDGDIDYSTLNHIGNDVFEILKSYEISKNDIALSIAGTIGKVIFLKNIPQNNKIILTENCAKIQIKDTSVLSQYLALLLILNIIQKQIELNYIQTTIPKLGLDRIRNLYLPPIPPLSVQQTIVDLYTEAQNQRKRKLEESQKLLESVDDYLLAELGIELPQEDNSLKNRIFKVSSSHLIGSRWDCSSNKNDFSLNSKKFENVKLVDIVRINPSVYFPLDIKEITFISMEAIDEIYGEITDNYTKEVSESTGFTRFMQDDLIWAKITPCMQNGKSAVVKETLNGYACGSTEFFVLRCNKNKINVNYLFYIMHLKKLLEYATNFFGGNAGQQRVSKDFLLNLEIPLPPLDKQIDIASKLQEIQNNAKQLKNEADMILQEAKQKVERMILGE